MSRPRTTADDPLALPDAASPSRRDDPNADDLPFMLSRLADGDVDSSVAGPLCQAWGQDAGLRKTWHEYQLIGDLLRSEDLLREPQRDADFLAELRTKLAVEPPIVAPMPAAAARPSKRWMFPSALAAGVVAAAGVLLVMQATLPRGTGAASGPIALSPEASAGTTVALNTEAGLAMIRDARIDMYLQAHRGMRTGATAAMPGGALRNVDVLLPR
jgi:sigma-E factor negative regulatory protein RseA